MRRALVSLRSGRGLPAFAALTLAWMILVILEGAVVRATGSGAGCGQHWPLCNGQILPHHPHLATLIEFTHRSMTGICSGLTFALIAWTFLAHRPGAPARKAAVFSGAFLILEAFLGAVLVLGGFVEHNTSNMRVFVQAIHFTNTLLLLATLSLTWWWQRPRTRHLANPTSARPLALAAALATIVTGATGSVAALADTLFPAPNLHTALLEDFSSTSPLLIRMRWMHPAASLAAFVLIALLAFRHRHGSRTLLTLLGLQILLGVADVLLLAPLALQVAHLLGADLLWIALIVVSADLVRSPAADGSSSIQAAPLAASTVHA